MTCLLSGESKGEQSDSSDHAKVYICTTMGRMLHVTFILTYFLTYLLTPRSRVLLEKQTGSQLVKKFPLILWKLKVHYRIYKCLPPLPILNQLDPIHTTTSHLLKIQHNIMCYMLVPLIFFLMFYNPKTLSQKFIKMPPVMTEARTFRQMY